MTPGLSTRHWLTLALTEGIVDKAAAPGTTSRALAVHARILEFYDQIGLAQDIIERGLKMTGANLWVGGVKKARVEFGDMGRGLSPFPYALIFRQDEHEKLLIERLRAFGITVERPGELVSKQELIARVWPNTFVDAGNLAVHIYALRRTLRDGRGGNRFIINIPGRGYSFVASVEISKLAGRHSKAT